MKNIPDYGNNLKYNQLKNIIYAAEHITDSKTTIEKILIYLKNNDVNDLKDYPDYIKLEHQISESNK